MGALMRKSTRKEFVNKLLDAMFVSVKHSCPLEREVFISLCYSVTVDASEDCQNCNTYKCDSM